MVGSQMLLFTGAVIPPLWSSDGGIKLTGDELVFGVGTESEIVLDRHYYRRRKDRIG